MAKPHYFRVDPRVVFKLGEELISDEVQALLELIKNAYDADASFVRVSIHTTGTPDALLLPADPAQPGWIEVADDGVGMDDHTIRDGWLLIAQSGKRDFKASGLTTSKGRTPLGDKGLGRLGVQRLGGGLQISTKTPDDARERLVAFSWDEFLTAKTLDQVPVASDDRPSRRTKGTVLTITELNDPAQWSGERLIALQSSLSEVISPYEGVSDFTITVSVDGTALDLQTLNRKVRETALLHYDIAFANDRLDVRGKATMNFFKPGGKKAGDQFTAFIEPDAGEAFFQHLAEQGAAEKVGLKKAKGRWFVAFSRSRLLTDIKPATDDDSQPISPGPFRAEIDSFSLAPGDDATQNVFGTLSEYRAFIKSLAGVRIYRDGFGVRTDNDWLQLGAQWTSARSYYGLKPDTTLGYVAISSEHNPQLVEKTDREGFIDTPAYRNFFSLMSDFLSFTGEVQELLRREYVAFIKAAAANAADVSDDEAPEDVTDAIDETLSEGAALQADVDAAKSSVTQALAMANATATSDPSDAPDPDAFHQAVAEAETVLRRLSEFLPRLETAQRRTHLVREELGQLRSQLEDGLEAMSLGLTAEALSHEMFGIADGLATRTNEFARKVQDGTATDRDTRRFVEAVRGSVGALRKELGHFSPSLRYVRDRRETLNLKDFAMDLSEYYETRWKDDGIAVAVRDVSKTPFLVTASRGKLTQVFDNLVLNSGYWLNAAVGEGSKTKGKISIRLARPLVVVADNGPGIEPSVEVSLFDPFVTRKPRRTGRGLGLFIVRQLLESEGCSIELSNRRGKDGRRREFVLNLSGMLDD